MFNNLKRKSNDFNLKKFKSIYMKTIYPILICGIVFLSSCSSAYKTAQTPDDVYYSPGSSKGANVSSGSNDYYNANSDDQYLMMKSQSSDPSRWAYFDDYSYDNFYYPAYSPYGAFYNPYFMYGFSPFGFSPFMSFGFGYGFGYPSYYLNNYYMWNGFYNPYYSGVIVATKYPTYNYYTQMHPFILSGYTGMAINNNNRFRAYNPNGVRTTSFSNNTNNRFSPNTFHTTNSTRFNSPNNSFFRTQSTQSTRSFSPSSFGGGGGGGGRSFGRIGR